MRSGTTLLFALGVLVLCSLFATMMATHHVAEGFAPGDPTVGSAPLTPEQIAAQMQSFSANQATGSAPLTPEQIAAQMMAMATSRGPPPANNSLLMMDRTPQVQVSPESMFQGLPVLPPEILATNKITDPVGTPLNPTNGQMAMVADYYAGNPKAPPTPLSLRDQLAFNYDNLPPELQTVFKQMGIPSATMGGSVQIAPDAPTSSWSRNGVQIVGNVPQMCAPYVQQTMDAMSFPPASSSSYIQTAMPTPIRSPTPLPVPTPLPATIKPTPLPVPTPLPAIIKPTPLPAPTPAAKPPPFKISSQLITAPRR